MDLCHLSLSDMLEGMVRGQFFARELTDAVLTRIAERQSLNAFITVVDKSAHAQARESDKRYQNKHPRPLEGIPIAIKDNICTSNLRTTCASRMLADFVPPYDATAVTRLKEAGAVIIGKTNLDEFGMGSSSEYSHFGVVHNPHDPDKTPGGSSGGSAAAVADFQVPVALGADTGGSIRQPAAFCGVVGLKPTYGAVSRYGLVAYVSSCDQIGVIARSVADCRTVFEVIRGPDPLDSTSVELMNGNKAGSPKAIEEYTIGIPVGWNDEELQPTIQEQYDKTKNFLRNAGCHLREVSIPRIAHSVPTYYIIAMAEASANLARYDGVRYGRRAKLYHDLETLYEHTRTEGLGEEVKRRILLGTFVLSAGYYDDYYLRAQKVRELIRGDLKRVFANCDFLLTPVTATTAFALGEKTGDPVEMYNCDVYTVLANLAGVPAMSIPVGKVDGLPVGMQIIGPHGCEDTLLHFAENVERLMSGEP